MSTNKKIKRHVTIMNMLDEKGFISVRELAETISISEMTIRRDIAELERASNISLINGIAIKNNNMDDMRYDLSLAVDKHAEEKESIGRYAASLVEDDDVIALDTGTTTERIAKYIRPDSNVMVICYALNVLFQIRKNHIAKIVFGGGSFRENAQIFESREAVQLIKKYRITKAFLSAAGVSDTLGVTCANAYEVDLKKAVMSSAAKKILVFDSSKYGKIRPAHFAELSDFELLITDNKLPKEAESFFREKMLNTVQVE